MTATAIPYAQPNTVERLATWTTDELTSYLADLKAERQALWREPLPPKRLSAVNQLIEDVHDVLWLRRIAAWNEEDAA